MTLRSMTGFARAEGSLGASSWHWEVRTVNGRGLDVRVRLPQGLERLEPVVRDACAKQLRRGNCSASLNVRRESSGQRIQLNEEALAQVAEAIDRATGLCKAEPARIDGVLAMKGVLEFVELEESEAEEDARHAAFRDTLMVALDQLNSAREAEGKRLCDVIVSLVATIEDLVDAVERAPARLPERVSERLGEQIARLGQDAGAFDPARLHQEAVLLAAKADIQEEIDRLRAHVAAARDLLKSDDAVGRRLDFLAQEFNREANTICSKANDVEITGIGLELKATIDQLREQVQNIE